MLSGMYLIKPKNDKRNYSVIILFFYILFNKKACNSVLFYYIKKSSARGQIITECF